MIKIVRQDGEHQYDELNRTITTWDHKKCAWIVNPEFDNDEIDWYGEDSDFPAGCTLKEYLLQYPNWDKMPNIKVTWSWNTKKTYETAFGSPQTFGERSDYYDKLSYPQICVREWGYIDCKKEDCVYQFASYADFHKHADNVRVEYNDEIVFNDKYKVEK